MKIHDIQSINVVPGALHCIVSFSSTAFSLVFLNRYRGRCLEAVYLILGAAACLHVVNHEATS